MSFRTYRIIDNLIFTIIYAVCEFFIITIGNIAIDQAYIVSLNLPILLILLIRWDKYSIFNAIAFAVLFVLFQGGSVSQMLIYVAGNIGVWLISFAIIKIGKKKLTSNVFYVMVYGLFAGIIMECFRYIASLILYKSNINILIRFLTTDALSIIFAIVILLIVRNVDGILVDQKDYIIKLQNDEKIKNI